MRLALCEAPTQKEQHKGQPQHRETSRPIMILLKQHYYDTSKTEMTIN